jgi:adenylate cyclase
MKLTLRVTVLSILISLLLVTVAALGYSSYRNTRFAAADLSTQILEQTSLRVDQQLNDLLLTANREVALSLRLFQAGEQRPRDLTRLARYWLEVMRTHPKLTRLQLALEADGSWFYVCRLPSGKLAVGDMSRDGETGPMQIKDYWPEDYPRQPFSIKLAQAPEDPRHRPWYETARAAGAETWSETYLFLGIEGAFDVPGVCRVAPLYDDQGKLLGVLSASFDVTSLCHFLQTLQIGQDGLAFVVEVRRDGSRQVIAHPQPDILLRDVRQEANLGTHELVPVEELADSRVADFLAQVPPGLQPAELDGAVPVRCSSGGINYLGSFHCLTTRETPDWLICTLLPEREVLGRVEQSNRETLFIAMCVVAGAVLVSLYISAEVAHPLECLAQDAAAIGRLQIDARPSSHSVVLEVDRLGQAMDEMKAGLRSFQKYVPADLVRSLLASGQVANQGGEHKTVTIFFSDIVNFTSLSEGMPPEALVAHLSEYLDTLSRVILEQRGTVDKYIGDGIMAFWGAPALYPQHALAACTAALRAQDQVLRLCAQWKAAGKPLLWTRMGINTGEVIVGNIGSAARLNYTVMGDAVNLASRLEGLNKYYTTSILISEHTFRAAAAGVVARPIDWVSVKGKTEAVLIYDLLGLKGEVPKAFEEWAALHAAALRHYQAQEWPQAIALLEQVLQFRSQDGPARELLARCQKFQDDPPGEGWDGVHSMSCK